LYRHEAADAPARLQEIIHGIHGTTLSRMAFSGEEKANG
jgi:hypothetical protein